MLWHKAAFIGLPGTGKTTMALSYPSVQQHCFGSSEETTAKNFVGRTDILPPLKLDWYETLKPEEKAKFTNEAITELEIAQLTKLGRARNVARYRRTLYGLKDALLNQTTEIQSVVLDNATPFAQEFEDYVEVVWGKDFLTKDGNFDTIAYYKRFGAEFTDFLRLFMSLPCHTLVTCHIGMIAPEEVAANTAFLQAAKMGGVRKDWQPLLTGKAARNAIASVPDWTFFLKTEETPGQPTAYVAKLEADESNVGLAKPRIQPYKNPRQIRYTKNKFHEEFALALETYLKTGVQV